MIWQPSCRHAEICFYTKNRINMSCVYISKEKLGILGVVAPRSKDSEGGLQLLSLSYTSRMTSLLMGSSTFCFLFSALEIKCKEQKVSSLQRLEKNKVFYHCFTWCYVQDSFYGWELLGEVFKNFL